MKLQILHVPDCPNTAVLAARLDEVLTRRADVAVEQRVVADQVTQRWREGSLPGPGAGRAPSGQRQSLPRRGGWRVPGQDSALASAEGLIGYSLDARLLGKTFWTLSAWESRSALDAFSRANPHATSIAAIRAWMRPTTFVFWTARGSQLPPSWAEARRRVSDDDQRGGSGTL